MPVTLVMLEAIRDFYYKTGKMIGMKPAGGISKSKLALHYLVMVKEVLGEDWLNNEWFRFGASSLANDVLMQIGEIEDGAVSECKLFSCGLKASLPSEGGFLESEILNIDLLNVRDRNFMLQNNFPSLEGRIEENKVL